MAATISATRPTPSAEELSAVIKLTSILVPAGITGLAQVSGGSDLSFDEWALLDTWYAENWTFLLDLRIMLKTVAVILGGRGAY